MEINQVHNIELTEEQKKNLQMRREMKKRIAILVAEQRMYKKNRLTVNFPSTSSRICNPAMAASLVATGVLRLRHYYFAYAIIRGKAVYKQQTQQEIEAEFMKNRNYKPTNAIVLESILKEYGATIVYLSSWKSNAG